MKCRACWANKAYLHEAKGWRAVALSWLGFVPLKCQHCYHKFFVFQLLAIGQQLTPPPRKTALAMQEPVVLAYHQQQTDDRKSSTEDTPSHRRAA